MNHALSRGVPCAVTGVSWSPDSEQFATCSLDFNVCIWQTPKRAQWQSGLQLVTRFAAHTGFISGIAWVQKTRVATWPRGETKYDYCTKTGSHQHILGHAKPRGRVKNLARRQLATRTRGQGVGHAGRHLEPGDGGRLQPLVVVARRQVLALATRPQATRGYTTLSFVQSINQVCIHFVSFFEKKITGTYCGLVLLRQTWDRVLTMGGHKMSVSTAAFSPTMYLDFKPGLVGSAASPGATSPGTAPDGAAVTVGAAAAVVGAVGVVGADETGTEAYLSALGDHDGTIMVWLSSRPSPVVLIRNWCSKPITDITWYRNFLVFFLLLFFCGCCCCCCCCCCSDLINSVVKYSFYLLCIC
jgi:hypothetical protein